MADLWNDLKIKIREILITISKLSKYHQISIINFSDAAITECKYKDPNTFDVKTLTFLNGGTSFEKAFAKAYELLNDQQPFLFLPLKKFKKQILFFMSDGRDEIPIKQINRLKLINFEFYAITFLADDPVMKNICTELGGKMQFAENPEKYKKLCIEILENSSIVPKK